MPRQPSTRVGVWVDGDLPLKVGEYNAKNITHLLSIGWRQLIKEGRHSVHLPRAISTRTAQHILEWVDQALPPTADDWTTPNMPSLDFSHIRPDLRLSVAIEFYMVLRSMGTRSDVQFYVAGRIFEVFRSEWRSMNSAAIVGLAGSIQYARDIFEDDGRDLFQDPVVRMIAHTFAYGIENEQFPDVQMVERVLAWHCATLKEFVDRVGIVRYPIRSLVATPAVYSLPGRRRKDKEMPLQGDVLAAGLSSPTLSDVSTLSGDDAFVFSEYPTPSLPRWSRSTISVKDVRDLGLDGWVMLTDVQGWETGGGGDEDEVMQEAGEVDIEGTTRSLAGLSLGANAPLA
ncbi:hypothetical protein SLS60_007153 [Paraconiothyrium brasiliense]|uniref:Cyclin N-terminal domain-containing protein n=1 Tax=Paraconiothyrium brasiliense TaxID=300254 RepID=A0ABR3R8K2_9PLEO